MWHKKLPFILHGVVVTQCKKLHEKIQYPIICQTYIFLLAINKFERTNNCLKSCYIKKQNKFHIYCLLSFTAFSLRFILWDPDKINARF